MLFICFVCRKQFRSFHLFFSRNGEATKISHINGKRLRETTKQSKICVSSNSTHAEELWGKCAKLLHTANTQINIKFQARKIIIIFFIDLNVEEYVWTMKQLKRSSNEKKEISTEFRFTFRMKIYHYQILNGLLWNDYCLERWFIGID